MERKSTPTKYEIQAKERIKWLIDEYCTGSQQALSERTGVGKASISQYVNGKNVPSNLTAKKISEPFGINPAWLMGFDVSMEITPLQSDSENDEPAAKTQRPLSSDEENLLDDYRLLNDQGQNEARKRVNELTEIDRYNISR